MTRYFLLGGALVMGAAFFMTRTVATDPHVIDGDTFRIGWNERVRVADIDAPETHPSHCPYEAELGRRATERLRELLAAGPFRLEHRTQDRDRDQYGRLLRIVTRNGESLGMILVKEGLARPWTGRREPWCNQPSDPGRP